MTTPSYPRRVIRLVRLLAVLCVTSLLASTWAGAEEGWSLSRWNPFKSNQRTGGGIQTRVTDQSDGKTFSMPKMPVFDGVGTGGRSPAKRPSSLPSFSNRTFTQPPQPSMWTKFSRGSKAFFARTKSAVTAPFQRKQPTPTLTPITGSRNRSVAAEEKRGTKSFFSSWLTEPEPEPQPPRTVSEFLKQPRVMR